MISSTSSKKLIWLWQIVITLTTVTPTNKYLMLPQMTNRLMKAFYL